MTTCTVDGLTLAYREAGRGPAVVLVHGWPTSSHLWRNVIPPLARHHRVVALDLPGFGESSKPLDGYGFAFFDRVLSSFLDALGICELGLAVHDLGGPVALHWAVQHPERVTGLALLNTLVYPEFSNAVVDFARTLLDPARRHTLTDPHALADVMRLGVTDDSVLTDEVIAAVQAPFASESAQRALAAAGVGLRRPGYARIAASLPTLAMPVRIIYGAQDHVLPDIEQTVARLRHDLPHADITRLPRVGHYVQEEAPTVIGSHLAQFFAPAGPGGGEIRSRGG